MPHNNHCNNVIVIIESRTQCNDYLHSLLNRGPVGARAQAGGRLQHKIEGHSADSSIVCIPHNAQAGRESAASFWVCLGIAAVHHCKNLSVILQTPEENGEGLDSVMSGACVQGPGVVPYCSFSDQ